LHTQTKREVLGDVDRDFTELYGDWREWRGMKARTVSPPVAVVS
jgi:hypothetical protein